MMEPFWIGSWRVDPVKSLLERDGRRFRVEPKAMRVLVYLAERAGEDLSRDEILRAVCDGSSVQAEVLTNAIWELRKVFGDDAREPDFIQTVSRKGYRLVAPVHRRDAAISNVSIWIRRLFRD